ncbi:PREDICTED: NACHT, LRR and PYD domains-containing protein 1-like [Dipodomys ordii]|uniref:NACHT, LRR and PYD domains-containing protein 1-like n=1 Tax=Dipodomys ordii TaxID=10020 RepID=A0A1S3EW04_DIPOR|nr:PREDICTED: NACHT, LRR and PYD domains-containing protein 1-like [Dipodomys ordii]
MDIKKPLSQSHSGTPTTSITKQGAQHSTSPETRVIHSEKVYGCDTKSRNLRILEIQRPLAKADENYHIEARKIRSKNEKTKKSFPWKDEYFTQLLLLQKPYPKGQEPLFRKSWHQDEVEERGQLIDIKDLFGPRLDTQGQSPTVILYGSAGIGKSTLARQVRAAWEEGRLYRDLFQHIFFISCRELDQHGILSLAELLENDPAVPEVPIHEILSRPEQLLFILDGVDELLWTLERKKSCLVLPWSKSQPIYMLLSNLPIYMLLSNLLSRIMLPEASLLITARTTALSKLIPILKQPCQVEVLGFAEFRRKEYFYKYFSDESQALKAFSLVESNPELLTLCLVPWVSWLVCTCLKQQMERGEELPLTSQTTTALCLHYLVQNLPAQLMGTHLMGICSLAAEGIRLRKTVFTIDDLRKYGLRQDVISNFIGIGILQDHQSMSYSFTHLCFQEFLAAVVFALWDEYPNFLIAEKDLPVEYRKHSLFEEPTIQFLFGLLSEQVTKEMKCITHQLPQMEKWKLLYWAEMKSRYEQPFSLEVLHCLYETQDEDFLTQVMQRFLRARMYLRTDMELLVATFCIKFCSHVRRLQLIGPQRQVRRFPGVVLSMWAPLTDTSWKVLFSTLKVSGSLKELDLSGNPLSCSAVQSLCETLRHPQCHLETLRLANCGLTSSCCQDLASVLSNSCRLRELDLRKNELGDLGVKLLCEGFRHPACQLTFLRLDQTSLSDTEKAELKALEEKRRELLMSTLWQHGGKYKPIPVGRRSRQSVGEWDSGMEEDARLASDLELLHLSGSSPTILPGDCLGIENVFLGPIGPVNTELIDRERHLCCVHFPVAGFYHCPNMGLGFMVSRAVTITIEFCSWDTCLDKTCLQHTWMIAGPLFGIRAEQGTVAAVHLPHFVNLQETRCAQLSNLFYVAHFKEEGMLLEKPARVESHCAVLENPSFSPIGVLLRMIPGARHFIPIICTTLLYYYLSPDEVTLHLYLVPCDCSIQKAIDEEEEKFQFVRIHKPPPLDALYLGSRYVVSGSGKMDIIPQELELCYRSPGVSQLFSEISVSELDSAIRLKMEEKKNRTLIWETLLKPGDLRSPSTLVPPAPKGSLALPHFVDRHRKQLVNRVTSVDSVLDLLHGQILSEEQYEQVRAEATSPAQMRKLFSFSRSWNWTCKDQLYQALNEIHPHLIRELLEKS